jgi:D-alanyl-D-alanine carboxypeptidase
MIDWLDAAVRYAESWLDYQMRATELPGCVLAVAAGGALVRERAFGVADLETGEALTPRHRFPRRFALEDLHRGRDLQAA